MKFLDKNQGIETFVRTSERTDHTTSVLVDSLFSFFFGGGGGSWFPHFGHIES